MFRFADALLSSDTFLHYLPSRMLLANPEPDTVMKIIVLTIIVMIAVAIILDRILDKKEEKKEDTAGDKPEGAGWDTPGSETSGSDTSGRDTSGRDIPGKDIPGKDIPGKDIPGLKMGRWSSSSRVKEKKKSEAAKEVRVFYTYITPGPVRLCPYCGCENSLEKERCECCGENMR